MHACCPAQNLYATEKTFGNYFAVDINSLTIISPTMCYSVSRN